ncbi:MAG: hypothetical protein H0T07_07045 [Actinobacteria bacterium]|nr:hypothetical protein [Actinomycetota bacterium]
MRGSYHPAIGWLLDDPGIRRLRRRRQARQDHADGTGLPARRRVTKLLRGRHRHATAKGSTTLARYLEGTWLPHMRTRVRPKTWNRYEALVRLHVIPRVGRVKLAQLRPRHLQAVIDEMTADGASAGSVLKVHRVLSRSLGRPFGSCRTSAGCSSAPRGRMRGSSSIVATAPSSIPTRSPVGSSDWRSVWARGHPVARSPARIRDHAPCGRRPPEGCLRGARSSSVAFTMDTHQHSFRRWANRSRRRSRPRSGPRRESESRLLPLLLPVGAG